MARLTPSWRQVQPSVPRSAALALVQAMCQPMVRCLSATPPAISQAVRVLSLAMGSFRAWHSWMHAASPRPPQTAACLPLRLKSNMMLPSQPMRMTPRATMHASTKAMARATTTTCSSSAPTSKTGQRFSLSAKTYCSKSRLISPTLLPQQMN